MRKVTGFVKLDGEVQKMIENRDIDGLSDLVSGVGTSRIVLKMESETVLKEWIEKLNECSQGMVHRGARILSESDPGFDDVVAVTGSHEKLARSDINKNRSWKLRYFVLKGKYLSYFTSQDGELKGQVRIRNGHVRPMDPKEIDGRPYCVEILEGIDLSSLDPDLLYEAKKIVSQGRKKDMENMIRLGIKALSISCENHI